MPHNVSNAPLFVLFEQIILVKSCYDVDKRKKYLKDSLGYFKSLFTKFHYNVMKYLPTLYVKIFNIDNTLR